MNAFDKVIGYEVIKNELLQICDMIHNREIYTALGAKMPKGVLLYGAPGLGKTLMARCFIAESGLEAYTVRKNMSSDDFIGEITETFRRAKDNSPSIIFLDDMDKFANEDNNHCDAEEYVAVQAGIDEVKDADVFVFATVNEIRKLPHSLKRSGRFDRIIQVKRPSSKDAGEIIKHYLKGKKVSDDINIEDIAMMINYSSCADLETILNGAAIRAAFLRKESITIDDFVGAVLGMEYKTTDNFVKPTQDELRRIALHEAGHLVICEVLRSGSVGMASIRPIGWNYSGGFIRQCKELEKNHFYALVSLGGKAAVEMYYADAHADGCQSDIHRAVEYIRNEMLESGIFGLGFVDVETGLSPAMSEAFNALSEAVVHAELERYLFKAKDILMKNRDFLEKAADTLLEKETLLYSDIKRLRASVTVTEVVA